MAQKTRILFLCTGNACRSQMAEGFANQLKPEVIQAASAGVETHGVNAHETCPWFPGSGKVIHRGFDDPPSLAKGKTDPEEILDCYRKVRDDIRDWVQTLPDSLGLTTGKEGLS